MKIQKLKIFVLPKQKVLEEIRYFLPFNIENMKIRNFHFYKTRNFVSKRVFYPYTWKTKKFSIPQNMRIINSHPYKTGSFESQEDFKETRSPRIKKILAPFKSEKFEGFESKNRKFSK
ncbi:MAG: hypothetical protein WC584_02790 [Candidatus Pacearchaeota archaeon]